MKISTWWGCFSNDADTDLITRESIKHGAKMPPLLTRRIYQHLADEYGIMPGSRVADPFGGIGMTGVIGARLGYKVTVIELEKFFYQCIVGHYCTPDDPCPGCQLEQEQAQLSLFAPYKHYYPGNLDILERHRQRMSYTGKLYAIQGDSREMVKLLRQYQLNLWQPDAIITSPPYADSVRGVGQGTGARFDHATHNAETAVNNSSFNGYGDEAGQIGKLKGKEYLKAVDQIYQQCYQALPPGRPLVVVIKSVIRNKKIIDLPGQTINLLLSIGFEVPEMAKAMVMDQEYQPALIEGVQYRPKTHETIWRRTSRKNGLPIDYEAVIFAVRP